MYSLLLAIIYIAFVSLGLPDSLVGAGWPVMHQDLGVPIAFAGIITMIIAGGTILSSLASERVTRRFGVGVVTAVSVGMTAAALVGFSVSGSFWMLCLWAIPYGLGAGAVDAALNNYVAVHYAARHMNWLHACWGLGASISPFIMSYALASGLGWSSAYLTIGLIQVVLTFVLLISIPLWGKVNPIVPNEHAVESGEEQASGDEPSGKGRTHVPLARAIRIPGVILILTAFFAYCALESTAILWASTYLVTDRGVAPATAAAFASLFLLGITAGRFLAGFFADRVGDRLMIRGGFVTVGLGVVMLALPLDTDVLALDRARGLGTRMRADLPRDHPFHSGQFRPAQLTGHHRHPDGRGLHRFDLRAAVVRCDFHLDRDVDLPPVPRPAGRYSACSCPSASTGSLHTALSKLQPAG